jgi:hypothetical protein
MVRQSSSSEECHGLARGYLQNSGVERNTFRCCIKGILVVQFRVPGPFWLLTFAASRLNII